MTYLGRKEDAMSKNHKQKYFLVLDGWPIELANKLREFDVTPGNIEHFLQRKFRTALPFIQLGDELYCEFDDDAELSLKVTGRTWYEDGSLAIFCDVDYFSQ